MTPDSGYKEYYLTCRCPYCKKAVVNKVMSKISLESLPMILDSEESEESKEPLIKDKKVRETVRAWVKTNEMKPSDTVDYSCLCYRFEGSYCSIDFNAPVGSLESGIYTIAELCGEEE